MDEHIQYYVIAALFVIAVAGTVFSAAPVSFSSTNLAGAATATVVADEQVDYTSVLEVLEQSENADKPVLILTTYEFSALPEDVREEFTIYIVDE